MADGAGSAFGEFPLVFVALEGGGAGTAQRQLAEAVFAGVALPASGGHAYGTVAWLAGGKGVEGSSGRRRYGILAGELAVDEPQDPRGPGLLAAGGVEAGEAVLWDSQLYDRVSRPVCLGLRCMQLGDLQWNALWTAVPHGEQRRGEKLFHPGACSPVNV